VRKPPRAEEARQVLKKGLKSGFLPGFEEIPEGFSKKKS
jgi:hypothetical protein